MQLYIGNKNYSSWSLRPWLLMTEAGIAFEERKLRLSWDDASPFKQTLRALSPAGRVPLLVLDDGFAVWDSLAIAETLAERFPEKPLWPADAHGRARARSLCAEMHAGFAELREVFPMNIEAALPEIGPRLLAERPGAAKDLARIDAMWREAVEKSGGPFLFGAFGIVDAFYAPVCTRVRTYGLPLSAPSRAYLERVLGLKSFRVWEEDALRENDFLAEDEPYRRRA